MGLFFEIRRALGVEGVDPFKIQYSVVDGKGGYFLNVRRLREFSEQKIVLQGKKSTVTVEGEGLFLGKYQSGDVSILGDIQKVERTE